MLPDLIDTLTGLGARFKSLPRPVDKPNATTVGISYPPTPESAATPGATAAATSAVTPIATTSAP